jgi:hypothetical protein
MTCGHPVLSVVHYQCAYVVGFAGDGPAAADLQGRVRVARMRRFG